MEIFVMIESVSKLHMLIFFHAAERKTLENFDKKIFLVLYILRIFIKVIYMSYQ